MGTREWGLLVGLSVLWGGSFFFAKLALAELPFALLVLARVALASLALFALLGLLGRGFPWKRWPAFLVMGSLNNLVPFGLMFWAQTRIDSGLAAILNATTPLWSVLLAHAIRAEPLRPHRLVGVLVGVAGVALMLGLQVGADPVAQLAVLVGAFSYAVAALYGRRFGDLDPIATAAGQLAGASLLASPLLLVIPVPAVGPTTIAAVVALALASTALGYVVFFRILSTAGATNLMLVTLLIPVTALLLGSFVLGERVTPVQLAGMALVGLGLAVIDGRLVRLAFRHR